MNERTTKPNGRSMRVEENSEEVQQRIENAGYDFRLNVMETEFTDPEKIQSEDTTGNASSSSSGRRKGKAKAGASATIAFTPLIPAIVDGPQIKARDRDKDKTKNARNTRNTQKTNKTPKTTETEGRE